MALEFENIYKYMTSSGVIIPDTSTVKSDVINTFKTILGNDIDTSEQTAIGRMIEAITFMIINIIGVNAQNANQNNTLYSTGAYLDACGALFNISRFDGESDDAYRNRIISSQSRGTSFIQSIRNAINNVNGVTNSCVLENNTNENAVIPHENNGIVIPPHSIFVSIQGGDETEIAKAILSTKSAGCGYSHDSNVGGYRTIDITDNSTNSTNRVYFYRPITKNIQIEVGVNRNKFTGDNLIESVKDVIYNYISKNNMNVTITKEMLSSEIVKEIPTITIGSVTLKMENEEFESLIISPNTIGLINKDEILVD